MEPYNCELTNDYRQIKKEQYKKYIENIVLIVIKHLKMNQISSFNNSFDTLLLSIDTLLLWEVPVV